MLKNPLAIEVLELTRTYGEHLAVDHISFSVPSGAIMGLLGPNGAGKSTTIKMLTTLLPPTFGTAKIMGYDLLLNSNQIRSIIGYVPQLLSADGDLSGYENLLLVANLYGLSKEKRKKRIGDLLEFMGLSAFASQLVSQYSGGMIRRLEIAQALLHNPYILFLDEPTVGLDPSARKTLWRYIEEWRKSFGTTIFITTHDMEEADKRCDLVAFMHLGHIVKIDDPKSLKKAIGPHATLDDVFMQYTGASIKERGDYEHAQQIRRTISNLD